MQMQKHLMTAGIVAAAFVASAAEPAATPAAEPAKKLAWTDTLKLKGDLRTRFESIDQEGKDQRDRFRIRARAGLIAQANDEVEVGLRLSTSTDNDPVSSNQTLGNASSRKDVFVDLAYIDWSPAAAEGLDLVIGKMENPLLTIRDLIWDGDLSPEGLAAKYMVKASEGMDLHANLVGYAVEERSADDDSYMFGGQLAMKHKQDKDHVLVGAGYYAFADVKGMTTLSDPMKSYGNASTKVVDEESGETTELLYATGFELLEFFFEVSLDASGVPLALYGDYVVNQDADDEDTGFMGGFKIGKTKDPGSVDFDYNYRELEQNAVLGAWTDSDSFGGGTDGRGHKISLGYQVAKNLKASASYFMQEIKISSTAQDYDRLQLDLSASF